MFGNKKEEKSEILDLEDHVNDLHKAVRKLQYRLDVAGIPDRSPDRSHYQIFCKEKVDSLRVALMSEGWKPTWKHEEFKKEFGDKQYQLELLDSGNATIRFIGDYLVRIIFSGKLETVEEVNWIIQRHYATT